MCKFLHRCDVSTVTANKNVVRRNNMRMFAAAVSYMWTYRDLEVSRVGADNVGQSLTWAVVSSKQLRRLLCQKAKIQKSCICACPHPSARVCVARPV
jgi:hypothetical protein